MTIRVATLVAIALISTQAWAQKDARVRAFVSGGLVLPLTPELFKKGWDEGYDLACGIGFRISPRLEIQGVVSYGRFSLDMGSLGEEGGFPNGSSARSIDRVFLAAFGYDPDLLLTPYDYLYGTSQPSAEISGAATRILSLTGELKVSLVGDPYQVDPYVLFGGGAARISREDASGMFSMPGFFESERSVEGISETAPLATVGGGVDIRVSSRIVILAEGRYQIAFTEGDTTGHAAVRGGARIGL